MKENDWIVAGINNPDYKTVDFKDIGLNMENTQVLPIDQYLKSSYIKDNPNFQNDQGTFDESKFKQFYTDRINAFKEFSEDESYQAFQYDLFDSRRPADGRVKDPKMRVYSVSNPLHQTKGTAGVLDIGLTGLTAKEQAQKNRVFDPETGKYEDYSPNDYALFKSPFKYLKSLFTDPLVYAQFEEDGVHIDPITGETVEHKAGDFKINELGEYYTEKLNGRNPANKTFVSAFDTITVDESGINKYDFFDADSADKSVIGSIASAAATVAPLFLGPEVALVYSTGLIGRELSKSLPLLGGFVDAALGTEFSTNSLFNSLSGKAQQLTGGTSEYSTQKQLTFENISKIVSDVATQWGQQKAIAKGVSFLRNNSKALQAKAYENAGRKFIEQANSERVAAMISGDKKVLDAFKKNTGLVSLEDDALAGLINNGTWAETAIGKAAIAQEMKLIEPILEKQARIGANASLAYMALISNTDVYQDMLDAGATKREAALVALGSTLGMYKVDRSGIGELFFDDLTAVHTKQVRQMLKKELQSWKDTITSQINNPITKGPNKLLNLIKTGSQIGEKALSNYWDDIKFHSTGFLGKAVGEGLEEVSEELVSDISKQLYEIAGAFDITSQKDVGAWKNAGVRYGMSFLGGALGGGIFYGAGVVNGQYPIDINNSDLLYLVRNGRTKEIKDQINDWKEKGKFGSVNLSATKYTTDNEGNRTYLTADSKEDSQNDFIADQILNTVNQVDAIINANQLNLTEDQLFDQMVLSEVRYKDLRDWLQEQSYSYGYQQEFQHIVEDLVEAQAELNAAAKTREGTVEGTTPITDKTRRGLEGTVEGEERKASLADLQQRVDEIKQRRDKFLSGDTSFKYTRKMLFALDSNLSSRFADMSFEQFVLNQHHKNLQNLTEPELQTYTQEYQEYRNNERKQKLDEEFDKFLKLEPQIAPNLVELEENSKEYAKYSEARAQIAELLKIDLHKTIDVQLEGDTPEYLETIRNIAKIAPELYRKNDEGTLTGEEEVALRTYEERKKRINDENERLLQERYNKINEWIANSGGKIDPVTFRQLWRDLGINKQAIKTELIENSLSGLLKNLQDNSNLSNKREFISLLNSKIESLNKDTKDTILTDLYGFIDEDIKSQLKQKELWEQQYASGEGTPELGDILDNYTNALEDGTLYEGSTEEDIAKERELLTKNFIREALENSGSDVNNIDAAVEYIYSLHQAHQDGNYVLGETASDTEIEEMTNELKEQVGKTINDLLNSISSNIHIKAYDQLQATATKVNPFVLFISKTLASMGEEDASKIEEVLQKVFNAQQALKNQEDFKLTPEEIQLFNKTKDLLDLIEGYLYAASSQATLITPYGHNKTINDFFRNHKDAISSFNELPEISDETYQLYLSEFALYKNELQGLIDFSNKNAINKMKKFRIADEKFVETRKQFFETNKDAFVITIEGKTYNLLDGVEKLTPGSNPNERSIYINKVEQLLYDNIQQLLADGYTFKQILDTGIIKKLTTDASGGNDIGRQLSAPLDEEMSYDKFTGFDKVIYFLTTASLGVSDWNKFNLSQITKYKEIIPLTIQQYVARIAVAKFNNSEIFNAGLQYLFDKKLVDERLNLLDNVTFISGIAGAGKSSVCAKWVVDWALEHGATQDDIWLTAPEKTQIENLKGSVAYGVTTSKQELFTKLFGIDLGSEGYLTLTKDQFIEVPSDAGSIIKVNTEKFKPTATKLPKLIVIDEGTYYSNPEYQLLNTLGIQVVVMGDPNQNGYQKPGGNIDREYCFTVRTPKLEISLRDNNLQNQDNQLATSNLLTWISSVEAGTPEAIQASKDFIKAVGRLKYRVYSGDELNGTLITQKLSSDTIKLIPKTTNGKDTTVGYVGSTDSQSYKDLVNAGFKPIVAGDVSKVQGQEFDYIIIDNQVSPIKIDEDPEKYAFNYFLELRKIYTLMSRGKIASVFVDPMNTMKSIVGENVVDVFKATAPSLKEAADTFRGPFLELLNQLVNEVTPKEITGKVKPKETTSGKEETGEEEKSEEGETPGEEEVTEEGEDLKTDEDDFEEEPPAEEEVPVEEIEFPEELVKDIEETNISLNDVPVYSDVSLVGVPVEVKTVVNPEGKEIEVQSWYKPTEGPKRDIGIFFSSLIDEDNPLGNLDIEQPPYKNADGTPNTLRISQDRNLLINSLMQLKAALLFKTPYSSLSSQLTDRFSEEDLANAKFKIEVRKRNNTDYITGSMSMTDLKAIAQKNDEDVLINVIAELNSRGEKVIVTLGALSDPNTQMNEEVKKKFIAGLQKSIDRFNKFLDQEEEKKTLTPELRTAIEDRIALLQKRIADNDQINANYKEAIDNIIDQFEGEPLYFDVNIENAAVTSTESVRNKEDLNFDTFTEKYSKRMLVSKPYIVAGNLPGVSEKMRGKAVVFVSAEGSRTTATGDALINEYLEQRESMRKSVDSTKDPKHSPKVRMLVLNSRGFTLESLLRGDNPKNTPFEWGIVGRKMLVSTWNFRANLLNFLDQYQNYEFTIPEGQDKDAYIEKVALAESLLYRASRATTNKQELLDKVPKEVINPDYTLTPEAQKVANEIKNFNLSLATEVKDFRLGGPERGTQYISKLTGIKDDNLFYDTSKGPVYGIYLTIERARKFEKLLDAFFTTIAPVVELKKVGSDTALDPHYIITGKTKASNNINNYDQDLINLKSGVITLENGDTIELGKGQQHAIFSVVLLRMLRKIWHSEDAKNEVDSDTTGEDSIDKGVKVKLEKDDGTIDEFNLNLMQMYGVLDSDPTVADFSYSDMFSLIFHGTTEDIITHPDTPKSYSAYFKKGIMMHPVKKAGSGITFGGTVKFFEAANPNSMFLIDRVPTKPIFRVSTTDIQKFAKEGPTVHTNNLDEIREIIPEEFMIDFDEIASRVADEDTNEEILEVLRKKISKSINNNLVVSFNGNSITGDTVIECRIQENSLEFVTLNDFLANEGVPTQSEYKIDEDQKISIDTEGQKYEVTYNSFEGTLTVEQFQADTPDDNLTKINTLKEKILGLQKYFEDDEDMMEYFNSLDAFSSSYDNLKRSFNEVKEQKEEDFIALAMEEQDFDDILKEIENDNCSE